MATFTNSAADAAANADAYIRGLLDVLGDRDPLDLMEELPDALDALVAGLADDVLRRPEGPGKWSIVEVVGHLADTELVYAYRTAMILAHESPEIQGYDQEAWVRVLRHRDAPMQALLARVRVRREANMVLYRSLSDEQLARCGQHTERGPESIGKTLKLLGAHDVVHRRQIERIRRAHRAA